VFSGNIASRTQQTTLFAALFKEAANLHGSFTRVGSKVAKVAKVARWEKMAYFPRYLQSDCAADESAVNIFGF